MLSFIDCRLAVSLFFAGRINHISNIFHTENTPIEQIEFRDVANYRHKSNLLPYGRHLLHTIFPVVLLCIVISNKTSLAGPRENTVCLRKMGKEML